MFQFSEIDRAVVTALGAQPEPSGDMNALERSVDARIRALRAARVDAARARGVLPGLHARLDEALRTDAPEHLDERDYPASKKVKIVSALHLLNRFTMAYARFTRALRPHIERVARRCGRPARVLELASGSGEFTLALAAAARRARLPVEVTGSDYVPEYVERARRSAQARGLDVRFEVIDAFDMSSCAQGAWDIVFIGQSVHHFTPGQLAKMIAQSRRIATTGFVAVDGRRSLKLLLFIPLSAALTLERDLVHDGALSARKLYAESELAEIAAMAAPGARVQVLHRRPGYSVLTAMWGDAGG